MQIIKSVLLGVLFVTSSAFSVAQADPVAPAAQKDWTMLVFINGHNSLADYGALNINQMETVGSTDHLNIVVQWAASGQPTQRMLVKKDSDVNTVTSPVVQSLPADYDMGSVANLVDFIKWGATNYPAKHYFVVVWDHGNGWHKIPTSLAPNDISWDDDNNSFITTEQLGQAMHQASQIIGHNVDIYGSDACLMAMIEVAHEMTGAVDVYVGSEETEAMAGWPYDTFLKAWAAQPSATPADISKMLVTAYGDAYKDQQGPTFSAFDMSKINDFDQSMIAFKSELVKMSDLSKLETAAGGAVRFTDSDYVDLGDVLGKIQSSMPQSSASAISNLNVQLKNFVIANSSATGAQGLSIWWPTDSGTLQEYMDRYHGLQFDKAVKWSDFLSKLPL